MVDSLDELAEEFEHTHESEEDIEDKLHEEIEFLLEDMTPSEVREEVEDHSEEFQDLVDYVIGGIKSEKQHD